MDTLEYSRLFIQCYGVNYIGHPRLESLLKKNNIKAKDFLPGAEEAKAFDNKEYIRLHQSTLRKVDVIASLLNRAIDNSLKVESKWWEICGLSPQGLFESITNKWWCRIIMTILSIVFGAVLDRFIIWIWK